MRKSLLTICLLAALICPLTAQEKPPANVLKVGTLAPDFTLKYFDGTGLKDISLKDFKGKKNVVLAFYIFAFTPGWTQEVKNFQQNLDKLEATDTQVVGVSMDSPFANKAFADSVGAKFPLASDWFNDGAVTKAYGAWNPKYRAAERVTYLIDKSGTIAEVQDSGAVDPTNIVLACERKKLKN